MPPASKVDEADVGIFEYVSRELPGIRGQLKRSPVDFRVNELHYDGTEVALHAAEDNEAMAPSIPRFPASTSEERPAIGDTVTPLEARGEGLDSADGDHVHFILLCAPSAAIALSCRSGGRASCSAPDAVHCAVCVRRLGRPGSTLWVPLQNFRKPFVSRRAGSPSPGSKTSGR